MSESEPESHGDLLALTANIVSAHVAHNHVSINDLSALISSVHAALAGLGSPVSEEPIEPKPAVPVKSSIKPDYIVCLEDGIELKMLKRHLMTHHGLTPEAYRARWNLPKNYPMVSRNYSAKRTEVALSIGLGQKVSGRNHAGTATASSTARSKTTTVPSTQKASPQSPGRKKLGVFTTSD